MSHFTDDELRALIDPRPALRFHKNSLTHIIYRVSFDDVECLNIQPLIALLTDALAKSETISVSFSGFDNDPRGLNQMTEVHHFVDALTLEFPRWLFVVDEATRGSFRLIIGRAKRHPDSAKKLQITMVRWRDSLLKSFDAIGVNLNAEG